MKNICALAEGTTVQYGKRVLRLLSNQSFQDVTSEYNQELKQPQFGVMDSQQYAKQYTKLTAYLQDTPMYAALMQELNWYVNQPPEQRPNTFQDRMAQFDRDVAELRARLLEEEQERSCGVALGNFIVSPGIEGNGYSEVCETKRV